MRRLLLAMLFIAVTVSGAAAQSGEDVEKQAVINAALDYMEGALYADADRVGRGVHVELTKVTVLTLPQTGTQCLRKSGFTQLVEVVRSLGDRVANLSKNVEVTVFDIGHNLATARAVGQPWYDYLQLAKIDGQWKIVNVLWAQNQQASEDAGETSDVTATQEDRRAVEQAALDYIEGSFTGSAERMARALHPELTKVMLGQIPQTGRQCLMPMGTSYLVEGTRAQLGLLEEGRRDIKVTIQDMAFGMASVKVHSAMYIDYLQMARINGEWKIINVLWVPNPGEPGSEE